MTPGSRNVAHSLREWVRGADRHDSSHFCCSLLALLLAFAATSTANDESSAWNETRTLSAPEAHQAAAADERFVYAIGNSTIAKYDRESGERLAVSTGPATHLNSGFLWQGRLYCAHSNYPQVPERSEIKVLDTEAMTLATFKDFGDFGGSLTWVVRRERDWWCNFAHYGDENARTTLVRFDEAWRELGRWTYPAEVVRDLGRYSISGAVWHGDELLATGHDHRVLYRLRLPEQGTVLEHMGTVAAPFTGQGIAHDPVSGGLVGIQRAQRRIVFAEQRADARPAGPRLNVDPDGTVTLRILTYNIHHGEGVDGRLDLERIARVITSVKPDLVALQEVDQRGARTDEVDQPAELARLTGLHVVFGGNIDLEGGKYGNAVLSRYPIARHENHALPRFDDGEQRGVLDVEIEVPGVRESLPLLATHLDHRRDDRERRASAEAINQLVFGSARSSILAGDLNATPDSDVLRTIDSVWSRSQANLPTIPVAEPSRQIDYVLFRPAGRWQVVETRVLDEAVASDHRPLLAVLSRAQTAPSHAAPATPRLPRDDLRVYRGPDGTPQPVRTIDDWLRRRDEIVRGMHAVMGQLPGPEKRCPLDVQIEEEVDRGSYVRRLITYASEPGSRVPAYLLVPKAVLEPDGLQVPSILCLHGTDNTVGHATVVGLGERPNRQYASELAERGYVTLAPSYPLLAKYQPDIKALGWESGTLKAVWDNIRGIDLLTSLPYVKPGAFGAIGHSLGGHNSVYTSVFDERVRVVVSSCGLDSYLDYHDGDEKVWLPEKGWTQTRYMPRLADYRGRLEEIPFDFHELIGSLAPRHVLIVAPLHDSNFRAASVDRVAAAARPVFELYGVTERLQVTHPDCEHDFPPEMREEAYALFDRVLR